MGKMVWKWDISNGRDSVMPETENVEQTALFPIEGGRYLVLLFKASRWRAPPVTKAKSKEAEL